MPAPISTSSSTVLAEPCWEPAIREIVSSVRVPPRSLAPALQHRAGAVNTELDPGGLDVVDAPVQQDPGHGVDGEVVAQGRTGTGDAGEVDRRGVVDEWERYELGEAGQPHFRGCVLDPAEDLEVAAPSGAGCQRGRTSSWMVEGMPTWWAVLTISIQVAGRELALGEHPPDLVVENLCSGAGERVRARTHAP